MRNPRSHLLMIAAPVLAQCLVAGGMASLAHAEGRSLENGSHYYEICQNDRQLCDYYMLGVLDMLLLWADNELAEGRTDYLGWCLPDEVSVEEIGDLVMSRLETYPDMRHDRFVNIVGLELAAQRWTGPACAE